MIYFIVDQIYNKIEQYGAKLFTVPENLGKSDKIKYFLQLIRSNLDAQTFALTHYILFDWIPIITFGLCIKALTMQECFHFRLASLGELFWGWKFEIASQNNIQFAEQVCTLL